MERLDFRNLTKERLYDWLKDLHDEDEARKRAECRKRHVSHTLFDDLMLAENGLRAGLLDAAAVKKYLDRFIEPGGEVSDAVEIVSFWFDLSKEYPQIDREYVINIWRKGLLAIKDVYRKAHEMIDFVMETEPADEEQLLSDMAEDLRTAMPAYDRFPLIFPNDKIYDPTLEERLEEIKQWGKKASPSIFDKVSWFIAGCYQRGFMADDLNEYLLNAAGELDFPRCDPWVAHYLIRHLRGLRLTDEARRRKVLELILEKSSDYPRGGGFYDMVAEEAVRCYLDLGDFEAAYRLADDLIDESAYLSAAGDLATYALVHGGADRVRAMYPYYLSLNKLRSGDTDFMRHCWLQQWFLGATHLAGKGYYFMDEPEVLAWFREGHGENDMDRVWRILCDERFQGVTEELMAVYKERLEKLVDDHEKGRLEEYEVEHYVRLLLMMVESRTGLEILATYGRD